MEEKEFKAWLDTKRRSINLRLDVNGDWWHDDVPFEHPRLIRVFNRGISIHAETGEPIIRIGTTWCYFQSDQSPYIVRRLLTTANMLSGFWLNTEVEISIGDSTFSTADEQLTIHHKKLGDIRFDRPSQAALAPYLREQKAGIALRTVGGLLPIK